MKRKLLPILALCIIAICSAFGFIACSGNSDNQENPEDKTHTVHTFNERATGSKYLKSAATCTESAVYYYSCACGETGDSTFEYGKPNGHREVIDDAVKPTCTETGLTEGKRCSVCKTVLVEQTEVKEKGHTEVIDKAVEPTCTEKGKTEGKHCSVCKTVLIEQNEIEANGHTEVIDDAVEPTCIRNGKTEGKHCSVCKDVFVAQNEIEAQGHLFENEKCSICETLLPTDGLEYTLSQDEKYYTLSGIGTATEKEIIISDFYNGKPVTAIGANALKDCSSLTGITIPDGITSIAYNAFSSCNKLTNIIVSENNTAYASAGGILYDKDITQFIHIPKAIKGEIVIPDGITNIGKNAFSGCKDLTDITIPDSVTSIGYRAFYDCSGLTSITIPDSVTETDSWVFNDCRSLTDVTIGSGLPSISWGMFEGCSKLANVTFGSGVTSIDGRAFEGCSKLTNIYYTGDVASWCAISGLSGLMFVGSENKKLVINGNEIAGNLIIPDNATSIGDYAFYGCSKLTSVTIPDSVTSIGYNAFVVCEGLTSITIGSGVTVISSSAFDGCIKVTNITVSENNTAYASQDNVLYNKAKTKIILVPQAIKGAIVLPDGVTSIELYMFSREDLTSITVSDNNPAYASQDGILYNKAKTEIILVPLAIKGDVVIPDGITFIDDWAFSNCSGLTSLTIPEGVLSIGAWVFNGCSGLTSITIPESVTSFGDDAFYQCINLKSITFNGTIAQWNAIKGSNGIGGFTDPNLIITCTDGKLNSYGHEITE